MAPIRYSLHYEDYSEHLMSRFGKLLQMQSFVDMTLMCSSHTLRVHKAVLAASSAYFQDVLQKQTGEPLVILKMRFSVLKSLVEFMYCGKTQCLEENLDELVSAAQFLKIKGLSKVTKEGLGITSTGELPIFTPPVVINRPPHSILDLNAKDSNMDQGKPPPPQVPPVSRSNQSVDSLGRSHKDTVVRIPFDIENGSSAPTDYVSDSLRAMRSRRGRPNARRSGVWETTGPLGRAAERALMRREQDSRKAIHHLKNLQTRQMQEYMDRVTLSQAVNSICGPDASSDFMNLESDLMYMDQTVNSDVMDPSISYTGENLGNGSIAPSYTTSENDSNGVNNPMSQYVNALKNAGLPTDLPILFESGDGSYINLNEQVLMDMVQSSEIQYEVIEQPNIIEKVAANSSEIKSIDDLSKSIERSEILKNYSHSNFSKDNQFSHEEALNGLNSILPDNLEPYNEQHNFVVMDSQPNDNNSLRPSSTEFPSLDTDMQFFSKSVTDDVKKFYEDQQLNDSRVIEQLCPTSTALDTSFNVSLLDNKTSNLNDNCYDFDLQLTHSSGFKDDTLDCLINDAKQHVDDNEAAVKEKEDIIKELLNIEKKLVNKDLESTKNHDEDSQDVDFSIESFRKNLESNKDASVIDSQETDFSIDSFRKDIESNNDTEISDGDNMKSAEHKTCDVASSCMEWKNVDVNRDECGKDDLEKKDNNTDAVTECLDESDFFQNSKDQNDADKELDIQLSESVKDDFRDWRVRKESVNKENVQRNETLPNLEDIPLAVGLLPMKLIQPAEETKELKRNSIEMDSLESVDAKCLKRKIKKH